MEHLAFFKKKQIKSSHGNNICDKKNVIINVINVINRAGICM